MLSLLFLFSACKKDALKKPTKVDVAYQVEDDVENPSGNGGRPGPPVSLAFFGGQLNIEKTRIIGVRKNADNIDFTREKHFSLSLDDGDKGKKVRFDLPQGTYKVLKLRLKLWNKDGNGTLRCTGERIQEPVGGPAQATPFRLKIKKEKVVECDLLSSGGKVELQKGTPRTIEVKVEIGKWFEKIGTESWNQASVTSGAQGNLIPIEKGGMNDNLHSKFLKRIDKAFKARVL
ncbi:MAG: hypothetical protein ABEH38_03150 [Flavobacteriales bacterium]